MTDERFYDTKEAARLLKSAPQTLRNWRNLGRGPKFRKHGRKVAYTYSDLMAWSQSNAASNTQATT